MTGEDGSFIERLEWWLQEQPEWVAMMAGSRKQRRATARLLAVHVMSFQEGKPGPGRAGTRKEVRRLRGEVIAPQLIAIKRRSAQLQAKAEKDRRRYARLGMERAHLLALEEQAARDALVAATLLDEAEEATT